MAAVLLAPSGCRHQQPSPGVPGDGEGPARELAVPPEVRRFYDFVDHVDLSEPRFALTAKHGDGSSCYLLVKLIDPAVGAVGRTWGAVVPEHCGTVVYAEVFAFTLGTLLGVGHLEGPARALRLAGPARDRVVAVIGAEDFSGDNSYRKENVRDFLQHASHHASLAAVAKIWGPRPYDADFLLVREALDRAHPLARFLRAEEAQPTEAAMTLPGIPGAAPERELARELSDIFVIDALANQRDRFSGGNLQVISVGAPAAARIHFVAYDNGDALDQADPKWIRAYLSIVTRFDRRVAERLFALERFLAGQAGSFQGFRWPTELQRALGLSEHAEGWTVFTRNLKLLVGHIESTAGRRYFED